VGASVPFTLADLFGFGKKGRRLELRQDEGTASRTKSMLEFQGPEFLGRPFPDDHHRVFRHDLTLDDLSGIAIEALRRSAKRLWTGP